MRPWFVLLLHLFFVAGCAHDKSAATSKPFNAPATTTVEPSPSPGAEPDPVQATAATAQDAEKGPDQVGYATWYGPGFYGKKTASGERFDARAMTAAHRKLPFGTWVEVRRLDNGAVVRVRINDRGPWHGQKTIIDLSEAAARKLGLGTQSGSAKVELRIVDGP